MCPSKPESKTPEGIVWDVRTHSGDGLESGGVLAFEVGETFQKQVTANEGNRRAPDREADVKEAGNEAVGRRTGTGYEAAPSGASGQGTAKLR